MTRPAPQTNPLGVAVSVGATIALTAGILLYKHPELILWLVGIWTVCGLLVGAVFVAESWSERRRMRRENKELRDDIERLNVECDALNQENMRLHLELTEAQIWAGGGPRLRVVPSPSKPIHLVPLSDQEWDDLQRETRWES